MTCDSMPEKFQRRLCAEHTPRSQPVCGRSEWASRRIGSRLARKAQDLPGKNGKPAKRYPSEPYADPLRKVFVLDGRVALASAGFERLTIEDGDPATAI